jgi:hypothetical protein
VILVEDDEQRRAARRAYIRASHPDRGGDPTAFMAGLARLDPRRAPCAVRVQVVRRQAPAQRLLLALARRLGWRRPPPRVR